MVIPEESNRRKRDRAAAEHTPSSSRKIFKTWLGEQKLDYTSAVEGMQKQMGGKKIKMRLSKGTNFNLPPIWVLAVELKGFSIVPKTAED